MLDTDSNSITVILTLVARRSRCRSRGQQIGPPVNFADGQILASRTGVNVSTLVGSNSVRGCICVCVILQCKPRKLVWPVLSIRPPQRRATHIAHHGVKVECATPCVEHSSVVAVGTVEFCNEPDGGDCSTTYLEFETFSDVYNYMIWYNLDYFNRDYTYCFKYVCVKVV